MHKVKATQRSILATKLDLVKLPTLSALVCVLIFAASLISLHPGVSAQITSACTSDINGDGVVSLLDYTAITSSLLKPKTLSPRSDLNNDSIIDVADYSVFVKNYATGVQNCRPQTFTNLLQNGDFETGTASGWSGGQIVNTDKQSGNYSLTVTTGSQLISQSVGVTVGKTYTLTGWFKWSTFTGSNWGFDQITITDNVNAAIELNNLHTRIEQNKWQKVAVTFVPKVNRVNINMGMFGPQDQVKLFFDNFSLFEKTTNQAPTLNPQTNVTTGVAPVTMQFTANAVDADGAVTVFDWDFGDGTTSRSENPSHTFISPGTYSVQLTAYDNDNAKSVSTVQVQISDPNALSLQINQPSANSEFSTASTSLAISGTASVSSAQITNVVWDNVTRGDAGVINITPGANVAWSANINLKPGRNEVLVTATTNTGRIITDRININRQSTGPVISNVRSNVTQLPKGEKLELNFDIATVAENNFFRYDETPPNGVRPRIGISVAADITTPSGKQLSQPAFYQTVGTKLSSPNSYINTNTNNWTARFTPMETGIYTVKLRAQDASGSTTVNAGTFTVTAANPKGFVRTSATDTRYFEFDDGSLYFPVGPAQDPFTAAANKANYSRPWLGGLGIYSTNWARWKSSAENHGNEGFMSRLNFRNAYPTSDLSYELFYPEGTRQWITNYLDSNFAQYFKSNTNYLLKLRVKVTNIAGPRDTTKDWGLTVKRHGDVWIGSTANADLSRYTSLIPAIKVDRDWHTIVVPFNSGTSNLQDVSIYLENVTAGQAYVDELSIREVLADGSLGAEIIRNPKADIHTYVEQRPAKYLDDMLEASKAKGIYQQLVVMDKNDWVPNHLSTTGVFVDSGDGYYQANGTKARWLLEQWWRYLAARWGYSTAIQSWELNNEGFPDDGSGTHAAATQDFAKFMKDNDIHRHLASTSLWCCWKPTFWGNKTKFPDIGYGDIHYYTEGNVISLDIPELTASQSIQTFNDNTGRPVIRGEVGITGKLSTTQEDLFAMLSQTNSGLWYHELLWAQLNHGGMSDPNYWYSEHLNKFDHITKAGIFNAFVSTLDLNKGGYVATGATSSNANIRVYGQKNINSNKAHMWIENKNHNWYNQMKQIAVSAQSATVTFRMNANTSYKLDWYDPYTGNLSRSEVLNSNAQGDLILNITNLSTDIALKINKS